MKPPFKNRICDQAVSTRTGAGRCQRYARYKVGDAHFCKQHYTAQKRAGQHVRLKTEEAQ